MSWSRKRLTQQILNQRAEKRIRNRHRICKIMQVLRKKTTIYAFGLKRCTTCDVYYSIPDLYCPCCQKRLRLARRDKAGTSKREHESDNRKRV